MEKTYRAGVPMRTHVPFSLEIGNIVENAIENGIIEMVARPELRFIKNIPAIVNVIGPIKEISASSLSVGFSNFLPSLLVFELVYSGQRIAEKNNLPTLSKEMRSEKIIHAGKPLPLNFVDLVLPYLFMCQSANFVEIPLLSE